MPYVIVEGLLTASTQNQGDSNYPKGSLSGGSTPERKPAFQVAVSGLKGKHNYEPSTLNMYSVLVRQQRWFDYPVSIFQPTSCWI